jgi:hypothetical protein
MTGPMRRVIRHDFTLLSALSLLLCVAAVVVWSRSISSYETIETAHVPYDVSLEWDRGVAKFEWTTEWPGNSFRLHGNSVPTNVKANRFFDVFDVRDWGGFRFGEFGYAEYTDWVGDSGTPGVPARFRYFTFPLWSAVVVTILVPGAYAARMLRRQRRTSSGRCTPCGYDLRAHAAGGRCPECGAAIAGAAISGKL